MYNNFKKEDLQVLTKGSENMDEMQDNSVEFTLAFVLEMIDKCSTLEELKESLQNILKKVQNK